MKRPDVVVVGGGIIGLMTAWRLAEKGLGVRVVDRGLLGREASLAAAGMLLPQAETDPVPPDTPAMHFFRVQLEARDRYSRTVESLESQSGRSIVWDREGALAVAVTDKEAEGLKKRVAWQESLGLDVEGLSEACVRNMAPGVKAAAAAFFPEESRVETRDLLDALMALLNEKGVALEPNRAVDTLLYDDQRVTGVACGGKRIEAGTVLLAAGAWTESLLPPGEATMGLRPSRGVLAVTRPASTPEIPMVAADGFYCIPLPRGEFLLGSTVEEAGFDRSVPEESLNRVLAGVCGFLPQSAGWPVVETRSGFRPRSADDLPVIGPGRRSGLWLATGHFRNGILLAPLTAEWVAEGIVTGVLPPEAEPFSPRRFTSTPGSG